MSAFFCGEKKCDEWNALRAERDAFARAIVKAKNEQGRGFLEEAGCPWCPGDEYGTPHDATCPVVLATAALARTP